MGTNIMLDPGEFFVDIMNSPAAPEGFKQSTNFQNCDGMIAAGETVNRMVTSTYFQPSTLRVIKQVECPPGVECQPPPSTFTIRVGNPPSPNSFEGSWGGTLVSVGVGSVNASEVESSEPNPPGLVLGSPNNCSGVINSSGRVVSAL